MAAFQDDQNLKALRDHFRGVLSRPVDTPYQDYGYYEAPNQTFQTPPPTAASLPAAKTYADGGEVGEDDYGYGRFTRTPAERRIARERRRDWTPPTDLPFFPRTQKLAKALYDGAKDYITELPEAHDQWRRKQYWENADRPWTDVAGERLGNFGRSVADWLLPFGLADKAVAAGRWVGGDSYVQALADERNKTRVAQEAMDPYLKPVAAALGLAPSTVTGRAAAPIYTGMGYAANALEPEPETASWIRKSAIPGVRTWEMTEPLLRETGKGLWADARDTLGFRGGGDVASGIRKIEQKFGRYQADRATRAADEGLLDRYSEKGLEKIFDPRQSGLYVSMPPEDFQNYALKLPKSALEAVPYPRWHNIPRSIEGARVKPRTLDNYLDFMGDRIERMGLDAAADGAISPSLWLSKDLDGLTEVNSHEGRHRMMTLDRLGDRNALVRLQPDNSGKLLRSSDAGVEDMVERLLSTYTPRGGGTLIVPEQPGLVPRPPRPLYGEPFQKGGLASRAKLLFHGTGRSSPHSNWWTTHEGQARDYANTSASEFGGAPTIFRYTLPDDWRLMELEDDIAEWLPYDQNALDRYKKEGYRGFTTKTGTDTYLFDTPEYEPFKDGGVVFVKKMRDFLGKEKSAALDKIARVTNSTKNEALIYGTVGEKDPLSTIVRGEADRVAEPEWASRFALDAARKGLPYFSAHTHPNNSLSPSLGDIQAWSSREWSPEDMLIQAWPQRSVLQLGSMKNATSDPDAMIDLGKKIRAAKSDWMYRPDTASSITAFANGTGLTIPRGSIEPFFRDLEAAPMLDYMTRLGVPVHMDANHMLPGTSIKAADVYPELLDFYSSRAGKKYAPGFDKGGSVLTRLAREVAGKPKQFRLPSGEVHDAAPIKELEDIAAKFARRSGNDYPIDSFPKFDEDRARRIAEAYDAMAHNPNSPEVRRAYEALIDETMDQYRALDDLGLNFHFMRPGEADPYAASPALGYLDLVNNGRLTVFPTEQGFGTLNDVSDNPLLRRVGRVGDLDNATANDAFRVVHDALGHFGPGNPFFRHQGEERAWMLHGRAYSPDALPAATSETRGQNSWVNFGPYGERNRSASGADTTYADQKTGLLPPWMWLDKASGGPIQAFQSEGFVRKVADLARKSWKTKKAEALELEKRALNRGVGEGDPFVSSPIDPRLQTVDDPNRIMYPKIYADPRDIVGWAKDAYLPDPGKEGPMFRQFGVTRQDLRDISLNNKPFDMMRPDTPEFETPYVQPATFRGSPHVEKIMNRRNEQRILDPLSLALKDDDLRTMASWYELSPMYDLMEKRLNLGEREQKMLNARMGVMSPQAAPTEEIPRGFLANYLANEGRLEDFFRYGALKDDMRPEDFPADLRWNWGHKNHGAHAGNLLELESLGRMWPSPGSNKVLTYIEASSPRLPYFHRPVADSHFTRMTGLPDVRTATTKGVLGANTSNPEYGTLYPWWNERIADRLGEYPRDAQALAWGVFGPATGVRHIGKPKLEMIADHIADVAEKRGIPELEARDKLLRGEIGGYARGGAVDDELLYHPFMFARGGAVDDDMQLYMSQWY